MSTLEWKMAEVLSRISPRLHYSIARRKVKGPYKGPLIDHIFDSAYQLEREEITQLELVKHLMALTKTAVMAGDFDSWIDKPVAEKQSFYLNRWTSPTKRKNWRFQIYHLPAGAQHPPHGHHDLCSFQLIVRGRLHVREYDRIEVRPDGLLRLRIVSDRILGPGEGFVTTEDERNVHWFTSLEEPVISINFNLRGYSHQTFFNEPDRKGGRRYILPIPGSQKGDELLARRADRQEAIAFIGADS